MKNCVDCTYYRVRKTEYSDGDCHRLPPNGYNITNETHWCGEYVSTLSALEKHNDSISMLVLCWTEEIARIDDRSPEISDYDNGYNSGYLQGIEWCRDGVSDVWKEGAESWKHN